MNQTRLLYLIILASQGDAFRGIRCSIGYEAEWERDDGTETWKKHETVFLIDHSRQGLDISESYLE